MAENNTSTQYNKTEEMKTSFQDGVNTIYNAIVTQGVTPGSKNPADIASAIGTLATNKYNAGVSAGKAATTGSHTIPLQLWDGSWGSYGTAYLYVSINSSGWHLSYGGNGWKTGGSCPVLDATDGGRQIIGIPNPY